MQRALLLLLAILCLTMIPAAHATEVVVDNDAGAPGYMESGSWTAGTSPGYNGGTYRTTNSTLGPPTHSATWTPDLPEGRLYDVFAAYRQSTNRTTGVPFTVTHGDGSTVVMVNQNGTNTMVETLLGQFRFNAGTGGSVRVDNNGEAGVVIADTVIWRTVVDPAPTISAIAHQPPIPAETETVLVTATITDNVEVTSASLHYRILATGIGQSIVIHDDGLHGDGGAGDSVYGATIPAQAAGSIVAYHLMAADELGQLATSAVHYYRSGPLPTFLPDVVVDNDDGAPAYTETGTWTTSASVGYAGGTYRVCLTQSQPPTNSATWAATLPRGGVYELYAVFLAGDNRTNAAPITITHADGESNLALNQTGSGIGEVFLGQFPFEAGAGGSVRMDNGGPPGAYIADAFIWRQPADPLPVIARVTRQPAIPAAGEAVLATCRITDNGAIASASLVYTVTPPGIPQSVAAHDDGAHGDDAAGDGIFGATIPGQAADAVVSLHFTATDSVAQSAESTRQHYVVGREPRHVYVVMSSDTSVWGVTTEGAGEGTGNFGVVNWDVFENRTRVLGRVYTPSFREQTTDSLGVPFKMTWFMHGGAWFRTAYNSTPISATYHIRKNWGPDIALWDDALEYHFHHYVWDGVSWEMAPTFEETIWEYEAVMSQMMIDERLFITSFRSGWNYMDNPYQQYLERWVPFRMEGARAGWVPYHPSVTNYLQPGTMKGWEVRHHYTKGFSQSIANQVFAAANSGTDQVVCIWSHQNEGDFPDQIADVDARLHAAWASYPGVQFHYCTAKEAMQRWLGQTGTVAPPLAAEAVVTGDNVHVTITTADDIYQEQPWVAARPYAGHYQRLDSTKTGPGTWELDYSKSLYDHLTVGVSDVYGNEVLADVVDGSRAWSMQSEFATASPQGVDLDTSPTWVVLASDAGSFGASGSVTFERELTTGDTWTSIAMEGGAPAGTSLRLRYCMAATQAQLDSAPWSVYTEGPLVPLPAGSDAPWVRVEVLLEGTPASTPWLDSLEIISTTPGGAGLGNAWGVY